MYETDERTGYRRSGRVAMLRFVPAATGALLTAGLLAWLLFRAFDAGWYYSFLTPAVAALPVALGHCRNAWVAGVLGFAAAVVLFLGHFHAHLVSLAGPQALDRIDLLPRFVVFRMDTDAAVENGVPKPPDAIRNWFYFGVDALVVWGIVAAMAVLRSKRAYCEECRRWMRRQNAVAAPGTGQRIADLLDMEKLEDLPAVPSYGIKVGEPCAMLDLEYCAGSRERATPCPAYLTAKEHRGSLTRSNIQTVLTQTELRPAEVAILAERVAAFRPLLLSALQQLPAPAPSALPAGAAVAWMERLPAEVSGPSRSQVLAHEVIYSFTPVIAFLSGLGLLVWAFLLAPWEGAGNRVSGCLLLAAGVGVAGFGAVVCWVNVDYFNFRYGNRQTRRMLAAREDALVAGDDAEAVYVDIVPRAHWTGLQPDRNSDRGLLRVDLQRRQVLFEGTKERIRIPAGAVLSCDVEPLHAMAGRWTILVTVLKVRYPADAPLSQSDGHYGDTWEIPFLPRPITFQRYNRRWRQAAAEELRDRIHAVMTDTV